MRPRVLLFEDSDILRSALESIIDARGFEVITFSNPSQCQIFDSVDHKCPVDHACADIIISDVNMPLQTGLEMIEERRQKGCKVKYRALMSGYWTEADLKSALALGCRIFHKPFSIKDMLKWIDDCIEEINSARKLSDLLHG